jgi:hypothetical protein
MMDTLIEKLHTAARRYCIDRYQYWVEGYSEVVKEGRDRDRNNNYTDEALRVFPRVDFQIILI